MEVTRRLALAAALPLFAAVPGCFWVTTKSEGAAIRKDVSDLQGRMARQEQSVDARVKQLDESLEKATALLKRNSADVGAEVEALGRDLARLTGAIEELKRESEELRAQLAALRAENEKLRAAVEERVAAAEARLDTLEKKQPPTPADKDALWADASAKLAAGQLTDARKAFRDYVKQFPRDGRADDAQYQIGETFVKEKQYEKAIAEYQRVIDGYPDGDMADDAFLAAANAAIEMKWCVDAKAYLDELIRRYPKSSLVKTAKDKLEYLKQNAKKKSVCQT